MAAPTIEQVMLGIEDRLATIVGLRVSEFVPDQINPPQAVVGVPDIENYRATMQRGRFVLQPTVTVFTSASYDRAGQLKLAGYVDPRGSTSVITAIEGDRTLGGIVDDCVVNGYRNLGLEEVGAIGYYGGVFTLEVVSSGA